MNILICNFFYMFRTRGFIFRKTVEYKLIVWCVLHVCKTHHTVTLYKTHHTVTLHKTHDTATLHKTHDTVTLHKTHDTVTLHKTLFLKINPFFETCRRHH